MSQVVAPDAEVFARRDEGFGWAVFKEIMSRPQPVTVPMVALFAIIPAYLYIGFLVHGAVVYKPELDLDRALPVVPMWGLVYTSLLLAPILPVFVVHEQELVRRTILAFLSIWLAAYVCFLAYPTIGPRPATVEGGDFFSWYLRQIWSADVRYNCFPSLHVAQCFLAALVLYRVHRGVGAAAGVWATLVAVSTLFTKQHYILDAVAGALLAYAAYALFLRSYPREAIPERERRFAPQLALCGASVYALIVAGLIIAYAVAV